MDALYSPTLTGVGKITVAWTLRTDVVCRQTSALVGAPVLTCSKHCGYSRIVGEV